MKLVPVFKCSNMRVALDFYTKVLDFKLRDPEEADDGVVNLINRDIEIQLTIYERDSLYGSVCNIWMDDVDSIFEKYLSRGLDVSGREESPVHQGPLNQTWGTREFYVTDMDGNTLRFVQAL